MTDRNDNFERDPYVPAEIQQHRAEQRSRAIALSRRGFIKVTGVAGGGLALGFGLSACSGDDPAATAKIKAEIAALEKELDAANAALHTSREKREWKEMRQLQANQRKVAEALTELRGQIDQYELNVANALWAEKTYPFKDDYFAKISKFYETGGIFPVDFVNSAEKVRLQINSWVEGSAQCRSSHS